MGKLCHFCVWECSDYIGVLFVFLRYSLLKAPEKLKLYKNKDIKPDLRARNVPFHETLKGCLDYQKEA